MSDQKVIKYPKLQSKIIARRIQPGDLISYKELCEKLNQPVYGGDQKKNQLKEFARYINFESVNRKYLIIEIYEKPLPSIKKSKDDSVYVKYIEYVLLQYLSKQPGYRLIIKPKDLWEMLGMVNEDYQVYNTNAIYEELYTLDIDMDHWEIDNFFHRCNNNIPKILDSSLESLRKRCLISYNKNAYMIGKRKNGIIEYHLANAKEKSYILDCKRNALKELGFVSETQVTLKRMHKEYFEESTKFLNEYGYHGYYKVYEIIYVQKNIIEAASEENLLFERKNLNNAVINRLNTQAENTYKKYRDNYEIIYWKLINNEELTDEEIKILKYDYPEEYVFLQKVLSNRLLKI